MYIDTTSLDRMALMVNDTEDVLLEMSQIHPHEYLRFEESRLCLQSRWFSLNPIVGALQSAEVATLRNKLIRLRHDCAIFYCQFITFVNKGELSARLLDSWVDGIQLCYEIRGLIEELRRRRDSRKCMIGTVQPLVNI